MLVLVILRVLFPSHTLKVIRKLNNIMILLKVQLIYFPATCCSRLFRSVRKKMSSTLFADLGFHF